MRPRRRVETCQEFKKLKEKDKEKTKLHSFRLLMSGAENEINGFGVAE